MGKIEIKMDKRQFFFDKEIPPQARIQSGDTVIFETEDADVSCITKETDVFEEFSTLFALGGGTNPVTGPVYIEGARPGDTIAVEILDIQPGYWRKAGYTSTFSGLGMLQTAEKGLQSPLEARTKICEIKDGFVYFPSCDQKKIFHIPVTPMIGTIGVAPERERRGTENLGRDFCGNIDLPPVKVGSTVFLKANVEGALLSLGDIHACQGDGEITGCALECQAKVEVRVTVIPKEEGRLLTWPQIEDDEYIGVIIPWGYDDYTQAVKAGYTELIKVLNETYGIDIMDAYQLLNLAGEVRIGSEFSCLCRIKKCIIAE